MSIFNKLYEKIPYRIRNWKAHFRTFWLGDENPNYLGAKSQLCATLIRANGEQIDLGVVSRRVITTAGANFIRDDFFAAANGADVGNMNYHDSGTGTTAEAIGQTDLITPAGPSTRATGTQTAPATNQYRTVATITYSGTLAITEHGLFSTSARASGTMLDRSVFSAINVVSGDAIQFQYTLTIPDGG